MMENELVTYEGWIEEVEARQRKLAAARPWYLRFFAGSVVLSALGFAWNEWVGAATLFTGVLVCVFGLYVVLVREGEYRRELAALRERVGQMRSQEANAKP